MSDRELLRLAAKAYADPLISESPIGGPYGGFSRWIGRNEDMGCDVSVTWNPLLDDGDRYRLAQKLGINIDYEDCCAWTRKHGNLIQEFWGGDCPDEAHVIVGVAAQIGKAKP